MASGSCRERGAGFLMDHRHGIGRAFQRRDRFMGWNESLLGLRRRFSLSRGKRRPTLQRYIFLIMLQ
jgi:hypothetical protein